MLACISLKEKCFRRCKKKRVVVLPPFYIYSYIGISSSAFLTIIPFSKKIKNLFLSFFLSGRAPGIHDYTWLNSIRFKGLRRHCPTLIIRDGQPALDADCYLRNGLMPARSSKWKDNKRLFFFFCKVVGRIATIELVKWTAGEFVSLFFLPSPFPTVSIARTVIIGTNGQVNCRLGGNGEKTNNGLLVSRCLVALNSSFPRANFLVTQSPAKVFD